LKVRLLGNYYGTQRIDFYCAILALFGVLVFEVLADLMLAVIIAIGLIILRISNEQGALFGQMPDDYFMDLSLHPEARGIEGVKILRMNITMFYANAPVIKTRLLNLIRESPRPKLFLIDMEAHYIHLDISSVCVWKVGKEGQDKKNVQVTFVGVNTVTMSDMEKQGLVAFGWQGSFQGNLPGSLRHVNG
jgi:MFS superfamily sulfate permease-like transporter